jgi:pectate lyase
MTESALFQGRWAARIALWAALLETACWGRGAQAQLPAFPGADGAAAFTTGGRGGLVYRVTKLDKNFNDNGPGTLRYGLTDSNFGGQPRTIVFDVAGTFWLGRFGAERGHDNGWDTQSRLNWGSHVTIAGQSAPGPVFIMGGVTKANGSNTILRNVTIAPGYGLRNFSKPEDGIAPTPGDFPDAYVYDAIDISGQGILIDHVTTVYATDETISINELADDVTIQYSSISQGQNYPQADAEGGGNFTGHGLGSLIQPGSGANISIHHNLYAHQKGRLPRVGTETGDLSNPAVGGYNDFRNNVFYNWLGTAGQGASGQPSQNNFVNNFYLAGPGGEDPIGGSNPGITLRSGGTGIFSGSSQTKVYASGNLRDTNKDGDWDDTSVAPFTGSLQAAEFTQTPYFGVTDSAVDAFDRVLDFMGANWWNRSAIDARIVAEVRSGTGKIMAWADDPFNPDPAEGQEWREMLALRANPATGAAPFVRPADWDVDGDGMPGWWEQHHGLSPLVANSNGDFDDDGYTDLEEYLNELAAWPAPRPLAFTGSTNNRYALSSNWDLQWQPSHFDAVIVSAGTVVVDAVGQHAGSVHVAPAAGEVATLEIADGWLRVENRVEIGVGGSLGQVVLSGGKLRAETLSRGTEGSFQFTGGTLTADRIEFDLVNQGGTLAPGEDLFGPTAGQTEILGNLTLASGALAIELGGPAAGTEFDQVIVQGDAHLGGVLDLSLFNGFSILPGDTFEILTIAGTRSGEFVGLSEGSLAATLGVDLFITYQAGDGNDVALFTTSSLPGDFVPNGVVDGEDFLAWQRDPSVGSLVGWEANFGGPASMPTHPVPEPASLGWMALLAASLAMGRRGSFRC